MTEKPVSISELITSARSEPTDKDLLTPLAASVLFGRSGEAVRRAAREGRVQTVAALAFTAKQVRLIDLRSAIKYWAEDPWPSYLEPLERQIADMRRKGTRIWIGMTEYSVLHPYHLVVRGNQMKHLDDA